MKLTFSNLFLFRLKNKQGLSYQNIMNQRQTKKKIKVKSLEGTPFLISQQQQIGSGNFGKVVRAYKKDQPSRELAAKIIPISQQNRQTIIAEIKILKQIPHHQNLVNCLKMQISTEHNFYLIMEYCNGGSFEKYIDHHHNCSEEIIWRFLREFTKGYRVLYDSHLIHRDIKPENILIHNGKFKIADFGLSRKIDHRNLTQNLSVKGTPLYIAPELQNQSQGNSKVDVFSLGIVLYRLSYNGIHPFYTGTKTFYTIQDYFYYLSKTQLTFPKFPKRSSELMNLIKSMLEKDQVVRIGWKEIFEHPQLKEKKQIANSSCHEQFVQLRKSIVQIGKSAAYLQLISQPFNHRGEIGAQIERLVQFTQYLPTFQVRGLEIFVTRSKVIIQIIKHLNGILKFLKNEKKQKLNALLEKIIIQGIVYCEYTLGKLKQIILRYETEINQSTNNKLIQNLQKEREEMAQTLKKLGVTEKYQHLKYENLLYDYLTEFSELKKQFKQRLKIPTALMIDLYDGLLKLQSMAIFNANGRIQIVDIELQDAELDKIDYENLATYQTYLDEINEVTLGKLEKSLKNMGLMIL